MDMTNKKTYFDLLDKLYDGTTTEAENHHRDSLTGRKYEANFNAYSDRRWDESSPELGRERIDRMRNDILSRIATFDDLSDRRSRRLWPTLCKAAAVVALVVGASLASYRYAVTSQPERQFEVVTAFGKKSSVTLPDGTRIWLNSGSRVSYSSAFNSRSRTVNLEGEAYFSVARNEQLPFVVQADGMSVTALGTKFNVKAYANEEEVVATLVEGRIRTDAGDESEIVLPENQASYNRSSGAMSVRPVENMELPMAWFNNKIVFSGETLDLIARTLERMYNVKVVFGDDACRRYAYRGLVHNNSLHNVLYLISSTSPVDYRITGNTVEFRSRQP